MITIRHATVNDAQQLIDFVELISRESENITMGPNEFNMTLEQEEKFISKLEADDNGMMFLAFDEGEIVGNLSYQGGNRVRTRHRGEFGITVRKSHWHQGIGKMLMDKMIEWAQDSPYCEKINLRVREDNIHAINLYIKYGFKVEGRTTRDMKINGEFVACLLMGLDIEK